MSETSLEPTPAERGVARAGASVFFRLALGATVAAVVTVAAATIWQEYMLVEMNVALGEPPWRLDWRLVLRLVLFLGPAVCATVRAKWPRPKVVREMNACQWLLGFVGGAAVVALVVTICCIEGGTHRNQFRLNLALFALSCAFLSASSFLWLLYGRRTREAMAKTAGGASVVRDAAR